MGISFVVFLSSGIKISVEMFLKVWGDLRYVSIPFYKWRCKMEHELSSCFHEELFQKVTRILDSLKLLLFQIV